MTYRDQIKARVEALRAELASLEADAMDTLDQTAICDLRSAWHILGAVRANAHRQTLGLEPGDMVEWIHRDDHATFIGWLENHQRDTALVDRTGYGRCAVPAIELRAKAVADIKRFADIAENSNQRFVDMGHRYAIERADRIAGWRRQIERLTASFARKA